MLGTSQSPPPAATKHQRLTAALAVAAVSQTNRSLSSGPTQAAATIVRYQATAAEASERAIAAMLTQQRIDVEADALLNSLAFTTETNRLLAMVNAATDEHADDGALDRLASALVQDAARAAESVAVAVRPDVMYVRLVNLPCCSRCAVLAGRKYRYSTGFLRHPGCDCVLLATTVAASQEPLDPAALAHSGQIRGLSQADMQAIDDGADLGQVVNVRRTQAGLREAGRVLSRNGRPTPEAIYASTATREQAVAALKAAGYIR